MGTTMTRDQIRAYAKQDAWDFIDRFEAKNGRKPAKGAVGLGRDDCEYSDEIIVAWEASHAMAIMVGSASNEDLVGITASNRENYIAWFAEVVFGGII